MDEFTKALLSDNAIARSTMKLFVFRPSNVLAGKVDIESPDDVRRELERFLAKTPDLPAYSYAECSGKTWTIMSLEPFGIAEGRVHRPADALPIPVAASAAKSEGERMIELLQFIELESRRTRKECEVAASEAKKATAILRSISIVISIFFLIIMCGGFVVVFR